MVYIRFKLLTATSGFSSVLNGLGPIRSMKETKPFAACASELSSLNFFRPASVASLERGSAMQKTVQAWFSGGPSSGETQDSSSSSSPSLLADWNSYASSKSADEAGTPSALGFDIEAAVRTANDKVSGTFNV